MSIIFNRVGCLHASSVLVHIRAGHGLGLDCPAEDFGDNAGRLELQHGSPAVHPPLDDNEGTLEDVDGLKEVLLFSFRCGLRLGADLGSRIQITLIGDSGLEGSDLPSPSFDLEHEVHGAVVAGDGERTAVVRSLR